MGSLIVLVSPNDLQVKAFDIFTGLMRWQIDARSAMIAASGDIALVYRSDAADLTGLSQDGRHLFTVSANAHAIAGDEAAAFVLDQGLGQAGSAPGNTLQAPPRSSRDVPTMVRPFGASRYLASPRASGSPMASWSPPPARTSLPCAQRMDLSSGALP